MSSSRRLATILSLDVAGYSRAAEKDDETAAIAVRELRAAIEEIATPFGGRIFSSAGDGFMLEFPSAASGVKAAVALLTASRTASKPLPQIRIGGHLGDVIVEPNGDLLGHGVNVAARLQALAAPGTAMVSETVRAQIRSSADFHFKPEGRVQLDKMDERLEAFSISPNGAYGVSKVAHQKLVRVAGVAAAAVIVLVLGVSLFAGRERSQAPSAATDQLIAVFEFTPSHDETALQETANAATDRMFQSIRTNLLGTVARTETRATPESMRFSRADELGARYALSGEVRPDSGGMTLAIRFEDVQSRLTLWERSFSAPVSDANYLPGTAGLETAEVIWCIVKTRSELTRDTLEILNLIADRCREGGAAGSETVSYMVARMRAVAEADPNSAFNQAQLVMMLGLGVSSAPPSVRAAWVEEAERALQRAVRLNRDEAGVYLARITLAEARGVSMAEQDAIILDALARSEGADSFVFGQANLFRYQALRAAGRFREALPHAVAAVANDPLTYPWIASLQLAVLGQRAQARAQLEPMLEIYGPALWETLMPYAMFLGAADANAMLRSPPAAVPQSTLDCMRAVRDAAASNTVAARRRGAAIARACGEASSLSDFAVLASLTALGDVDAAFDLAGRQAFSQSASWGGALQVLFWPAARPMRADPRFLQLVEELGMMEYWRTTGSEPDVCRAEPAPFCAALAEPHIER